METLKLKFNRVKTHDINKFNISEFNIEDNIYFFTSSEFKEELINKYNLLHIKDDDYLYIENNKAVKCVILNNIIDNLRITFKKNIKFKSIIVIENLDEVLSRQIVLFSQQFRTDSVVYYTIEKNIELLLDKMYNVQFISGMPANIVNAEYIVEHALKIKHKNVTHELYSGLTELEKANLHCIANVSKGSNSDGKLLVMRFNNGSKKIGIAGKGIIFDTGGINLKTNNSIYDMFCDMTGAITAIELFSYCVETNMNIDLMISIPLCENAIGNNSYRPGDIISSHKGLNVDVLNTDAEGRVVLADAVSYLNQQNFKNIITIATLTGLSDYMFGPILVPFISNNKNNTELLKDVSSDSIDKVVELPLIAEYDCLVESNRIENAITNCGIKKFGGVYHGASFIKRFVSEDTKFLHLDIAGTAREDFFGKTSGSTAFGLDLLIRYLIRYDDK